MRRAIAVLSWTLSWAVAACGADKLAVADPVLEGPEALSFGAVWLPASVTREVRLVARGGRISVDAVELADASITLLPITLPRDLASGEALTLYIQWNPTDPGAVASELVVRAHASDAIVLNIPMSGEALAVPTCTPTGPCRQSLFDMSSGLCVES